MTRCGSVFGLAVARGDLTGPGPAIVGLVWSSVATIGRGAPAGAVAYALTVIVTFLMLRTKLAAPLLILLAGGAGVVALR